ncbi:MAG: ketoacyl-ACP synthase III [Anaerolineae bacterium]|nr:MAG: ketoacyl-ACP synthase III [Anaerolineae bacterium]
MDRYAHITGWGRAIPEKVLTNDDLSNMVETSDEWIRTRTGIRERHIAAPQESTATLASQAALEALRVAGLPPSQVELIIVASSSPEHLFPATACLVQDHIGATKAGAFDLSAACTGFIYALSMAAAQIRSGAIDNALVIGAETLSRLVNWEDRNTCVLFGDGAGAFVLQASQTPGGVLGSVLRSDGSGAKSLMLPAGGSRHPATMETVRRGMHYIQMNGREVFRFATRVMAQATRQVIEESNLEIEDIALVIPHQANQRIIDAAARGLKLPPERFMVNLERYGNTSTASIPIAACEAVESGRLKPGDHVVLVGFGAGLTWGALLAQWSGPLSAPPKRVRHISSLTRIRAWVRQAIRRLEGWIWGRYPDE